MYEFRCSQKPIGWRVPCAFDTSVYETFADAKAASLAHPEGGCEASLVWENYVYTLPPGGERAKAMLEMVRTSGVEGFDCQLSLDPVPAYAEQCPVVLVHASSMLELLRSLGLCETPAVEDLLEVGDYGIPEVQSLCMARGVRYSGSIDPADLAGRCLLALNLTEDLGRPLYWASVGSGEGAFAVAIPKRPPGELDATMRQILALAQWCADRELLVTWS